MTFKHAEKPTDAPTFGIGGGGPLAWDEKMREWFAIQVHTCCERQVEDLLRHHLWIGKDKVDVETFLPVQKAYFNQETGNIERNRMVVEGLVFVCFVPNEKNINAIRRSTNVLDFYLIPGTQKPATIPVDQIERLRLMLNDSPGKVELVSGAKKGDKVRVISGNLKGLIGTLEKDADGRSRIYVEIEILGKCVRTLINKADTVLCEDFAPTASKSQARKAATPTFLAHQASLHKQYSLLASANLMRLTDNELCNLVNFYKVLLGSTLTLPILRNSIWSTDKYCYQYFFANVYRELASRVKATRVKAYRAPLLHALHCLCNQVAERAYTIKTNVTWVQECIARTNSWFLKSQPRESRYHFVRLLMDAPPCEESSCFLASCTSAWHEELKDAASTLTALEVAQRLQLKDLQSLLPLLAGDTLQSCDATTAILMLDAMSSFYSRRLVKSPLFATLQDNLQHQPPTISLCCAKAICNLHSMENILCTK